MRWVVPCHSQAHTKLRLCLLYLSPLVVKHSRSTKTVISISRYPSTVPSTGTDLHKCPRSGSRAYSIKCVPTPTLADRPYLNKDVPVWADYFMIVWFIALSVLISIRYRYPPTLISISRWQTPRPTTRHVLPNTRSSLRFKTPCTTVKTRINPAWQLSINTYCNLCKDYNLTKIVP